MAELVNETFRTTDTGYSPLPQDEIVMHVVEVPERGSNLSAHFVSIEEPPVLFATNIRVYKPGNDQPGNPDEQQAWAFDDNGTMYMDFPFAEPEPGTWTFRLAQAAAVPTSEFVIQSLITVALPATDAQGPG